MGSRPVVFNHVGLCVRDRVVSRRFYEGLLGFEFWWELDAPEESTAALLQLARPVGLHATYLVRDGLVLELLDYSSREVSGGGPRVMDQVGLTHISFFGVGSSFGVGASGGVRGFCCGGDGFGGGGDGEGSGWAVVGTAFGWVVKRLAWASSMRAFATRALQVILLTAAFTWQYAGQRCRPAWCMGRSMWRE